MLCDNSSDSSSIFESSSSSSESEEDTAINKASRIEDYTDVITRYTDLNLSSILDYRELLLLELEVRNRHSY